MELLIKQIEEILNNASKESGFIENLNVSPCTIESMGDYQCNNCLMLAKKYKKSPLLIASEIVKNIKQNNLIQSVNVAPPGYINIFIKDEFLFNYLESYTKEIDEKIKELVKPSKIIIDYGGANVAKPLHVGHLRSANIGESIKRICTYVGNTTIGDVHLGDWGLQMGMIIAEIKRLQPNLPYFDENFLGEYPSVSPITIQDLVTLYPNASQRAKNDKLFLEQAQKATFELQKGKRGYVALWRHIINISKADLKKNYDKLNVNFDLWLGESDCKDYYDKVVDYAITNKFAYQSQGAYVIDVAKEEDKIEIPPFILLKSDGAALYSTTDLATIVMRDKELNPDRIIYVVDLRQDLHFTQVFRAVKKLNILSKDIQLQFVGFGTMNGKDGKPYKTREGKAVQLADLLREVKSKAIEKVKDNQNVEFDNKDEIAEVVSLSALKFADLSIFRTRDYVFDVDKFCSFEGKTGPYILYTVARINSIFSKNVSSISKNFKISLDQEGRRLILGLIQFDSTILTAYSELAPSYLCDFAYKISNLFSSFYAKSNIIYEKDMNIKSSKLSLCNSTKILLEKTLNLLAIKTLNRM